MIAFFAIVFGAVALDQLTKYLAVKFLKDNAAAVVIKNVLQFDYIENEGAAFGMLAEHRWVFLIVSTAAIIATIIYMYIKRPQSKLAYVSISFIVGGGIGNMIDRLAKGYVVDFIDFYAFPKIWRYTFNVADSFVCVGAGMLILYLILEMVKEYKLEKSLKLNVETEVETEVSKSDLEDKNENNVIEEPTDSSDENGSENNKKDGNTDNVDR